MRVFISSLENYVPFICWIHQTLFKHSQIFWISPGNWSRHVVPLTILLIIAWNLAYFLKYEFSFLRIKYHVGLFNATVLLTVQLLICGWDEFSFTPEIHMSTCYHIVLHRFQRYVQDYCLLCLSKQPCEVGGADTFISFLCTWKLNNNFHLLLDRDLMLKQNLTTPPLFFHLWIEFGKSFW